MKALINSGKITVLLKMYNQNKVPTNINYNLKHIQNYVLNLIITLLQLLNKNILVP